MWPTGYSFWTSAFILLYKVVNLSGVDSSERIAPASLPSASGVKSLSEFPSLGNHGLLGLE